MSDVEIVDEIWMQPSGNLFLGGRYFADYYYLTCSLMHFCCTQEDSPSSVETSYENGNSFKWEFKNQDRTVLGARYEDCWEETKVSFIAYKLKVIIHRGSRIIRVGLELENILGRRSLGQIIFRRFAAT